MGDRLGARRVSGNCVARATSRPREGALWVAMVQKVLSRARVGVLVACGCAGAVTTAPRARCEHCRPSRQLFRRRARARAAANARFCLLDAVGALCSRTRVRGTRLRCFGAAQCQVRRPSVYTSTEQPEGMTPRSYLHSTWRWGGGGLLRVSQGCVVCVETSERGSRRLRWRAAEKKGCPVMRAGGTTRLGGRSPPERCLRRVGPARS